MDGILLVDKEKGMTSHDVVHHIRKRFGIKKVGHAGTLDPNATGLLVILLGGYTRRSADLMGQEKEYFAVMKFGEKTDTGDSDGKVIESFPVNVSKDDIIRVMDMFRGEIEQVPPMFSAKKHKGKKLYDLARKGIEVERPPVRVVIKEIEIVNFDIPFVEFRVVCSKGTYIRQLADDIGQRLGCGAHLVELRRSRSGDFSVENAVSMDAIRAMDGEKLNESILRI
ncbi:MAG TPA: tRNA pseudouridine(55) synthase TruB [Candidatus Omnitrophota bacterium]|nr:tRNA pseudouridine(55) synthase TruB [Candidatus Omnitrophota bacterium]HPS20303.1 tRNA pseudouridine(55) synthase TruB [Candidatus Omnitrophota bacterium]